MTAPKPRRQIPLKSVHDAEPFFIPTMTFDQNHSTEKSEVEELRSVSVRNPDWKTQCERVCRAGATFRVTDVQAGEEIRFIAEFANAHRLLIESEVGGFRLTPNARPLRRSL